MTRGITRTVEHGWSMSALSLQGKLEPAIDPTMGSSGLGGVPPLVCYDIVPFLCRPMRVIPLQRILRFAPNCDTIHRQHHCLLRSLRSIDAPLNVVLVPALVHYPACLPPCHTTLQPHHNGHFSSVKPPQAFPLTHSPPSRCSQSFSAWQLRRAHSQSPISASSPTQNISSG